MNRAEAVALVLSHLSEDALVVAADGAISREAFRARDRQRTFYMLGSMGHVASIALGLALTRPEPVIALDGDGNALMGLGNLALIGGLKPPRLFHVVLDNRCYATTGGQPSLSSRVDLAAMAGAAGYAWAHRCDPGQDPEQTVASWLTARGPAFLNLAVEPANPDPAKRIPLSPEELANRFRTAVVGPSGG